jgi:hypothetical protein
MRPSIRLALAGSVLATVAFSTPAFAATSEVLTPSGPTVSSTTVQSGHSVVFSGGGFAPGSKVSIRVNGSLVGEITAGGAGNFSTSVTMEKAGTYTLSASGVSPSGQARTISTVVTVSGAAAASTASTASTTNTGGLPFTGLELGAITGLGSALVLGGVGIRVASRRRREENGASIA